MKGTSAERPAWCKVTTHLQVLKHAKSAKHDKRKQDKWGEPVFENWCVVFLTAVRTSSDDAGSSGFTEPLTGVWASLVAQTAKRLPPMWETWVQSLGWEDSPGWGNSNPLQYSCLENPIDRGAWGLQCMRSQRVGHDWATSLHLSVSSLASMSAAVPWILRNSVSQTFCSEVPRFSFFFFLFCLFVFVNFQSATNLYFAKFNKMKCQKMILQLDVSEITGCLHF